MMQNVYGRCLASLLMCLCLWPNTPISAQQDQEKDVDQRILELEKTLQYVLGELENLKKERIELKQQADRESTRADLLEEQQQILLEEMEGMSLKPAVSSSTYTPTPTAALTGAGTPVSMMPGLMLGGYGEHHFNFREGTGGNVSDIHRFVGYVGYQFADWVRLNSELELEHAFVNDGDGEISVEQLHLEMLWKPWLNFRIGRMVHPAGIINRIHEPTTFYGAERPTYSRVILPSTWSIDGAGIWGYPYDWLKYEAYVHGGLDGSGFSASSGLRGGRLKERPSLNDPGFSGRIDFFPLVATGSELPLTLRTGWAYSWIGTENGNQGVNTGRPDDKVSIYAFDTDMKWGKWEVRGELAYIDNPSAWDANSGSGTADALFGTYGQIAYHVLPDAWKEGRLQNADAVLFARYDYSDPQYGNVPGGARNRTRSLKETTVGMSFYPANNIVLKMDYTWADSVAGNADNRFDLGFGYDF